MRPRVSLTFRHIERSGELEARLLEAAERLVRSHPGMTRCHVTVEGKSDARAGHSHCTVKIHVSVPGAQIHADSVQHPGEAHHDVYAALREAYSSARRQLQALENTQKSSLAREARAVMRGD
jgi:ribosome-associated translation inhibitor RaiA